MADEEHLAVLRQGVDAWNAWREENDVRVDLTEADLIDVQLFGANLAEADLSEANLTGADLAEANLTRANLTGGDPGRGDPDKG